MRLLELQRSALGLTAPAPTRWETRYAGESISGITDDEAAEPTGRSTAVLAVELTASPASAVIPGTVITYALSIANEGSDTARQTIVTVPVPGNGSYRTGSLVIDGRNASDDAVTAFFSTGVAIAEIAPGNRSTFIWKVGVRLGAGPLVAVPSVRSENAAVIGARSVRVTRRNQRESAFAVDVAQAEKALLEAKPLIPVDIPADELPIYELDAEEEMVYEAADAALSSAAPPPVELKQPIHVAEPAAVASPEAPVPEPAPLPDSCRLYARFDRTTLVFFERVFNGSKPPALLQHCIFASALACAQDGHGEEIAGLKRHLDGQSQVLHRIALHEKLGKREPIAEYAGEFRAEIDGLVPRPVESPGGEPGQAMLETELSDPTLNVLRKIWEERERWDFVKARQLTLALQAQRAITDDKAAGAAIENALRNYAQLSMTTLQKLFVRIRIDRTTGLLFANEPALDVAARAVVAALSSIIER